MIELARHIEYLLLHNDRVSVPELGVFTVTYREARLLPDGSSFLPPVRSIGFLPGETGVPVFCRTTRLAEPSTARSAPFAGPSRPMANIGWVGWAVSYSATAG